MKGSTRPLFMGGQSGDALRQLEFGSYQRMLCQISRFSFCILLFCRGCQAPFKRQTTPWGKNRILHQTVLGAIASPALVCVFAKRRNWRGGKESGRLHCALAPLKVATLILKEAICAFLSFGKPLAKRGETVPGISSFWRGSCHIKMRWTLMPPSLCTPKIFPKGGSPFCNLCFFSALTEMLPVV